MGLSLQQVSRVLRLAFKEGAFVREKPNKFIILINSKRDPVAALGDPLPSLFWAFSFYGKPQEAPLGLDTFYRVDSELIAAACQEMALEASEPLPKKSWQPPDFELFCEDFKRIQSGIHRGQFRKIVPIVCETSLWVPQEAELAQILLRMLSLPISLYPYGFFSPQQSMIGATPELLYRRNGQSLQSMALAGTLARGPGAFTESLFEDVKEQFEHKLVVDFIAEKLKPHGQVQVEPTSVEELPHLYHLKTKILASSSPGFEDKKLLMDLHPTPALAVSPRNAENLAFMASLSDQTERGYFGAPLCFPLEEGSLALVAIRCLSWDRAQSKIYAGCGVVADSQLQKEWQELKVKRDSVKMMLGI